jgi:predicted nucleotidyltransferase
VTGMTEPDVAKRDRLIETMVARIVERFHPLRVVLFGSSARGSDLCDINFGITLRGFETDMPQPCWAGSD